MIGSMTFEGKEISVTRTEEAFLRFFEANTGETVTRTQILEEVWGKNTDTFTNVVDVYINRLRHKIGANRIKTIRGVGYAFQKNGAK